MVKFRIGFAETCGASSANPSTSEAGTATMRLAAAAELLGVSQHTLRRWADAGKVPCRRTVGGQRRFRRSDIQRLQRHSELPQPDAVKRPQAHDSRVASLFECGRAVSAASRFAEALDIVVWRAAVALGSPECAVFEYDAKQAGRNWV